MSLPTPPPSSRKRQTKLPFAPQKTSKQPVLSPVEKVEPEIIPDDDSWKQEFDSNLVQQVEQLLLKLKQGDSQELEQVLKQFDLETKYGPMANMKRLDRWERASNLGLNPPESIHAILKGLESIKDPSKQQEIERISYSIWTGGQF